MFDSGFPIRSDFFGSQTFESGALKLLTLNVFER